MKSETKTKALIVAFTLSFTATMALVSCSDDDDNPAPSSSPSASATMNEITLVCPPPLGTIDITTAEDQWAPGYVVGTNQILDPVAFGEMTFTNTDTGDVQTEPAVTKTGADTTGAVECAFTDTLEGQTDETGAPLNGTVSGTVLVVERK